MPKLGRWITTDPIGFEDGPNLYAYVHNSPLTHFDLYGNRDLVSVIKPTWKWCYWAVSTMHRMAHGRTHAGEPTHHPKFERRFDLKSGSYSLKDYGREELPCGRITMINGILNQHDDVLENALKASDMIGGHAIHFVYNASHGFVIDLIEANLNAMGVCTAPVYELHKLWMDYFLNDKTGAPLLHLCHSQGAAITKLALETFPKELRERIIVKAFAPFRYIPDNLCKEVSHYVSEGDIIHRFDRHGKRACADTIVTLERHPEAVGWIDHAFNSPTFRDSLCQSLEKYLKEIKKWQSVY